MLEPCSGEPVILLLHRLVSSSVKLESEGAQYKTFAFSGYNICRVEVGTVTSELPLRLPSKDVLEIKSNSKQISTVVEILTQRRESLLFLLQKTRRPPMEIKYSGIKQRKESNWHLASVSMDKSVHSRTSGSQLHAKVADPHPILVSLRILIFCLVDSSSGQKFNPAVSSTEE